jgi:hypothetical protein
MEGYFVYIALQGIKIGDCPYLASSAVCMRQDYIWIAVEPAAFPGISAFPVLPLRIHPIHPGNKGIHNKVDHQTSLRQSLCESANDWLY